MLRFAARCESGNLTVFNIRRIVTLFIVPCEYV